MRFKQYLAEQTELKFSFDTDAKTFKDFINLDNELMKAFREFAVEEEWDGDDWNTLMNVKPVENYLSGSDSVLILNKTLANKEAWACLYFESELIPVQNVKARTLSSNDLKFVSKSFLRPDRIVPFFGLHGDTFIASADATGEKDYRIHYLASDNCDIEQLTKASGGYSNLHTFMIAYRLKSSAAEAAASNGKITTWIPFV